MEKEIMDAVETPCIVIDMDRAKRNIDNMQNHVYLWEGHSISKERVEARGMLV